MDGLLNAPKNTRLYEQLETEKRITEEATGNNTDLSMNFKPKMNYHDLLDGYKSIIRNIYSTKPYYKRLRQLLSNYKRISNGRTKIDFLIIAGLIKSVFVIGIVNKGRREYWKLIIWTLIHRPGP